MKPMIFLGILSLCLWGCEGEISQLDETNESNQDLNLLCPDSSFDNELNLGETISFRLPRHECEMGIYFFAEQNQLIKLTISGSKQSLSGYMMGTRCEGDSCLESTLADLEPIYASRYAPSIFLKKDEQKRSTVFFAPIQGTYYLYLTNEDFPLYNLSSITVSLENGTPEEDKESVPVEYCRLFDNDINNCDKAREWFGGCAYYSGDNQCRANGTDPCRLSDGDPMGCPQRPENCAYFPAIEQCHLIGYNDCFYFYSLLECTKFADQCEWKKEKNGFTCLSTEMNHSGCAFYNHDERACGLMDGCIYAQGACHHQCWEFDDRPEVCVEPCAYYSCSNSCFPVGTSNWLTGCD